MSMANYLVEYVRKDRVGDVAHCKLTGECCGNRLNVDCRSCMVPVYIWMLKKRERTPRRSYYCKEESE